MKRTKRILRKKRHRKIRAKVIGTKERPRLSVFRSNKHIYVQLIDDEIGRTLIMAKDTEVKTRTKKTKTEQAFEVGRLIAKKALDKKITKVVFDRGGYKYHGRVKALAEGAREGGLKF